ncbi:DUF6809 family protein [Ruminococcus sp.]|uniref:DUF6809 family protein n=1 Tax=Ruminococcus sp. TaxID=41978 RepID=UPI003865077E
MTTPVLMWRFLLSPKSRAFWGPRQSTDTKKKLAEMTRLLDGLLSMLTTEHQKEKLEQIENCQLSLIALSEKDAYIEGFKLGVRMTTEIYADTQQWG